MRDHFDPLGPLVYQQSQHHDLERSRYRSENMQEHIHQRMSQEQYNSGTASPNNPFDSRLSTHMDNAFAASASGSAAPMGTKRASSNDILDCNVLQSSLKRVRLSRCPGEFRLQRDLKTLDSKHWGSSNAAANAINFSSTTWIHRATGARLTMVDSLRICLFLPMMAFHAGGPLIPVDPQQQYLYQKQSYHRDYRWRIMIQIPRMYPHRPPVVTRIEGLSLESIAINDRPPESMHPGLSTDDVRPHSSVVAASTSLFFTEEQLARSSSSAEVTSMEEQKPSGSTMEWNQWSPISGLGELLDFLMGAAASNLSTTETFQSGSRKKSIFVPAARMASSSCSSLSSVSSSSSSSGAAPSSTPWGPGNQTATVFPSSFLLGNNNNDNNNFDGSNNAAAANTPMLSEEIATTSSNSSNVSGASFLLPNRFDVGYGRSGKGFEKYNHNPTSFACATGTTHSSLSHGELYRETQGDDDVGMDIS